jgi:hypothetical protein
MVEKTLISSFCEDTGTATEGNCYFMGALLVLNVHTLMTDLFGKYIAEVISNFCPNNYKL